MLERMWRRGNTFVLLMGMQIDIAIMKDGMEIPLKTKNKTIINSVQFSHSLMADSFQSMGCNTPASLSLTIFWSLPKFMSIQLVMSPKHLTLCRPLSFIGISQARILEWIAIYFSIGPSWPRNQTPISCIAGRFFTDWATRDCSWFTHM